MVQNPLSKYFTWKEVTDSETARKFRLDNSVPAALVPTVQKTALHLDAVRLLLGHPVLVNSWYRGPAVNWNVGGSTKSQHMRGEAVDFRCPGFGTPLDVCKFLQAHMKDLEIDQLIYEISWVHISFSARPRNQALTYCKGRYLKGFQACGK